MKGKFFGDYYIDCSCGSSLRRYFRLVSDEPRPAIGLYEQSQFASRVEYLRFCQRYAMYDRRCAP
jgi:hypothetical protein